MLARLPPGFTVQRAAETSQPTPTRLQPGRSGSSSRSCSTSFLFLLVGLQFSSVIDGIEGRDAGTLILAAAAVGAGLIALRVMWMLTMSPFVARAAEAPDRRTLRREQLVMGWSGMRGALSLAAALALPLASDGDPFPARSLRHLPHVHDDPPITLVPPALTLPPLLRRLGLAQSEARRRETNEARRDLAHAALERIERLARNDELPEGAAERLRGVYETRLHRLESTLDGDDDRSSGGDRNARHGIVEAQRTQLARLRREGLPADIARELRRDLDLEESRLGRY